MYELKLDVKESIEEYLGYAISDDDLEGIMNNIRIDIQDRVDEYIDAMEKAE